ncbi:MAG: N-acetylmuramoyl-L-alanine amidase [Clostridia bacterium]|nr:N-acetylmuramoyl-L-alanine amidase [Clostridia bacterium]
MADKHRPIVPPHKAERYLTLAVGLLVLIGGLLAVAAWRKEATSPAPHTHETPAPTLTPAPIGPLSGLTILVDPGHGGYDGGARCRDSGIWEKHLNLAVALEVEKSLVQRGASVIMTRRTDEDLCEEDRPAALTKKRQDMQNRVAMAVDGNAHMVLSIHMNEYRSRAESGPQVFYREGSSASRLLAGCIQSSLISGLSPRKERVAMAGDYFILQLEVPSVLIECGFISNAAEEKLLLSHDYQARLGEAIAGGVEEYLRLDAIGAQ